MINQYLMSCVLCGAAMFVVGTAFHYAAPAVMPQLSAAYDAPALRPWPGWTRTFMIAYPWCYATIFAGLFALAQTRFGAQIVGGMRDGLLYGLAIFVAGSLPIFVLNYASFAVQPSIIAAWAIQNLCQMLVAGAAIGSCYPRAA